MKKNEKLFDAIGQIDERYIAEALEPMHQEKHWFINRMICIRQMHHNWMRIMKQERFEAIIIP